MVIGMDRLYVGESLPEGEDVRPGRAHFEGIYYYLRISNILVPFVLETRHGYESALNNETFTADVDASNRNWPATVINKLFCYRDH